MSYSIDWAKVDLTTAPMIVSDVLPGAKSQELHAKAVKFMKGFSGQVKLFPVVFESGYGCTLTDVDGNTYIDYVLSWGPMILGHTHPKVTAALKKAVANGTSFGAPTELEITLARMIK